MQKWKYRHYKWEFYEVLWIALHSETWEKFVVYKCLYETPELIKEFWEAPFFVRPYDMFYEEIDINWKKVKRFEFIW